MKKERPAYMPMPEYMWQFGIYYNQNLEMIAQHNELTKLENEAVKKLKHWQTEISKLEESQAKGAIIHPYTWEMLNKRMDEIRRQKARLISDKERLAFNIGLANEKLYSYFQDVNNDHCCSYINNEDFKKYLLQYHQILKAGKGLIVFTEVAKNKIQAAIDKFLPALPII